MTAVGGFGVTPSCTLIFLTNFIGGRGCWFVMVLLRMFTDIICRQKLYHVDFRCRYQYMGNSFGWSPLVSVQPLTFFDQEMFLV